MSRDDTCSMSSTTDGLERPGMGTRTQQIADRRQQTTDNRQQTVDRRQQTRQVLPVAACVVPGHKSPLATAGTDRHPMGVKLCVGLGVSGVR